MAYRAYLLDLPAPVPLTEEQEAAQEKEKIEREMAAYDALPPEARAAFREARMGVPVQETRAMIAQRGIPREMAAKLKERGLLPYQLDEAELLAEMVRWLDDKETREFSGGNISR